MTPLQEHFVQTNKMVHAHTNLPKQTNTVSILRHFYDTIESQIRGLSALGKPEERFIQCLISYHHV